MSQNQRTEYDSLGRTYRITPIQSPEIGAAFLDRQLSRIPLSPPLILQLDTWDEDNNLILPDDEELQGLVCHLTLQTVDGDDASNIRYRDDGRIVNMSAGHHVKTAIRMLDQTGAPGLYFVFTDTGVRHAGRFRFKAFLMRISGNSGTSLDFCTTEPFDVVDPQTYIAPPQTELTAHFAHQNPEFGNVGTLGDWIDS